MNALKRPAGLLLVVLAPVLLSMCSSSTETKQPTAIVVTPGADTLRAIGRTQQFSAVVDDQHGQPITAAVVTWSSSDTTKVSVGATTGVATAVAPGAAQITATSGAANKSVAVAVVQVAAQVSKVSGDAQTNTVGKALAQPLVVSVVDSTAHVIAGASVTFAVTAGGGTAGSPTATTSANGQAQSTWTVGTTSGAQHMSAGAGAAPPVQFTATATPGAANKISKQAGDGQTRGSGTLVLTPPSVVVRDTFNNAVPGVAVTFSVPDVASGSVTGASQTTNASGVATVGGWTLGAIGTDTLLATVNGTSIAATFTATSQAIGAPANVALLVGDHQPGLEGYGVNVRPAVLVTDAGSSPVPNATVTFAVASGGGSVTGGTATTNGSGIAQVGKWTLGAAAGVNTLTATVTGTGITGNPVTFTDTAVAGQFTVQVQYYGNYTPSAAEQAAFAAAATRWEQIIYRHFGAPTLVQDAAGTCGAGEPALNTTVTDVLILASFDSIDGPGKTLAYSGPCFLRFSNGQTAVGVMKFDTADVAALVSAGQLDEVVLHEMNHVLGFGTLWSLAGSGFPDPDCLQLPSDPPGTLQDTYFTCTNGGSNAIAEFDSIGGATYAGAGQTYGGNKVPVENCANGPYTYPTCGAGTVNGHWRETVFGNELMTGYINSGSNPLSVVSVAAEQDLGYTVNYDAADAYTHTFTAPSATGVTRVYLGDDIRHGPIYAVDRSGVVRAVIVR